MNNNLGDMRSGPQAELHFIVLSDLKTSAGVKSTLDK